MECLFIKILVHVAMTVLSYSSTVVMKSYSLQNLVYKCYREHYVGVC